MANADVLYIIIDEFSHQLELGPIILFIIDEDFELGLYSTILSFGLADGLNLKSTKSDNLILRK